MIGMCHVIFSVLLIHVIFVTDQPDLSGHLKLTPLKLITSSAKAAPGGRLHQSLYQRSLQKKSPRGGPLCQIEDLQGISNIPRNRG
jgi:hypothetical protein